MLSVHSGRVVRNTQGQLVSAEQNLKGNFKADSATSKISIINYKMVLSKLVSKFQISIDKAELVPSIEIYEISNIVPGP